MSVARRAAFTRGSILSIDSWADNPQSQEVRRRSQDRRVRVMAQKSKENFHTPLQSDQP